MHIAYFVHELEDPAVRRRAAMLAAGGAHVEVLGFRRGRHAARTEHAAHTHALGRTRGGALIARIGSVLLALPRAWRLRPHWAGARVLMARNLEMLAIATVLSAGLRARPRIVYECLDIHRLMLSRGLAGSVLRAIERACARRAALIVTSSPAFAQRYFRDVQKLGVEVLIQENKVLELAAAEPSAPAQPPAGPPWRIAWCGVLRCRTSFELLMELAIRFPGRVEVDLWGAPALDQIPDFHDRAGATPGVAFHGRYAYEDLPRIYGQAHFVWAVDYYEAGGNSDWLLPNRLYEGLRWGAVPIAVSGVETARWLEDKGVGAVLAPPLSGSLSAFMESCTPERWAALHSPVAALERSETTLTPADCRALTAALAGEEAAPVA